MTIDDFQSLHAGKQQALLRSILAKTDASYADCIRKSNDPKVVSGGKFRPSYIGGCPYKSYYLFLGGPTEPRRSENTIQIFDTGTAIHGQIQEYYARKCGDIESFEAEVVINDTPFAQLYKISGRADGVITLKDGTKFILEIKTTSKNSFNDLKTVPAYYRPQALLYMKCLDIPITYFHFYCKDNSAQKTMCLTFDEDEFFEIMDRVFMIRSGEVPDPKPDYYECRELCTVPLDVCPVKGRSK